MTNPSRLPSSTSLPDLTFEPFPRLTFISYFRSTTSPCPSPPRSIPPTPYKMMANLEAFTDSTNIRSKKRLSTASAIPRPTSGSSRRATPVGARPSSGASLVSEATLRPSRSLRKSFHPNDGKPPSAWTTPRQGLPRSESMLPYAQRPQRDLSGVKQQLQMRHYSTRSLPGPEAVGVSPSLPQAANSLLSPNRDITPRRRLLQPIGPPLPRSHTIGNISCTSSATTPSPPVTKPFKTTPRLRHSTAQVNVIDALLESRMTDEEIEAMNQVQMEASTNQLRLERSVLGRRHKQKTPCLNHTIPTNSFMRKLDSVPSVNLSVNDVANTIRLEEQRRRTLANRPLFINTILANANRSTSSLPTPSTIDSNTSSGPDDEWEINLKHVHFAEEISYWVGRYMTICDRMKMADMNSAAPASPSSTSSSSTRPAAFESADVRRMDGALEELRVCCRTTKALKSFEKFETELRKKYTTTPTYVDQRINPWLQVAEVWKSVEEADNKSRKCPDIVKPSVKAFSSIAGTLATAEAMTVQRNWGKQTLTKSKTTGNLATLIPKATPKISPSGHIRKGSGMLSPKHARHSWYFECTPEMRAKALKQREERANQRATKAQQRSNARTSSYGTPGSIRQEGETRSARAPNARTKSAVASTPATMAKKVNRFDDIVGGTSCAMLESGHPMPPPPVTLPISSSAASLKSEVEFVNGEKVVRSRARTDRQSSGEIVKNLFGAGIREVRKMGRRVGGSMSWGGSEETLS